MARKTTVIIKQMARNNVIAEFSCGDSLFGILSFKKGTFSLEIYPPSGDKWELDLEDFQALIEQGKQDIMAQLNSRSSK
ncbi:hypothetical protein [Candidatus Uabimicrobium sp. HlEnr_7]|uniref:hypothetical protein n=1 Tax=Candidatus Uabimicrobium helgolandensis TaxID=3095367 RepID=UPI0035573F8C